MSTNVGNFKQCLERFQPKEYIDQTQKLILEYTQSKEKNKMWISIRYLFDECFQQDGMEIKFDKYKGMYKIDFTSNKILHIMANNYNVEIKEVEKRVDVEDSDDFEISVFFSFRQLRILYERYQMCTFRLSDIDDLEDTESSDNE